MNFHLAQSSNPRLSDNFVITWCTQLLKIYPLTNYMSDMSHIQSDYLFAIRSIISFALTRIPPTGEVRRNDAPLNLKIYADILCVISDDLALKRGRIVRLVSGYSVTFCSRPEAPTDVVSDMAVQDVSLDISVKLGDSKSNDS